MCRAPKSSPQVVDEEFSALTYVFVGAQTVAPSTIGTVKRVCVCVRVLFITAHCHCAFQMSNKNGERYEGHAMKTIQIMMSVVLNIRHLTVTTCAVT